MYRLAAVVTLTSICCIGHGATAQMLDNYFPQGVPGYDQDLGVTVQSRLRPDYDPVNIRLGSFVVRPVASESVGYNSNVAGTTQSKGSPIFETKASLGADSNWSRNALGASVDVDNQIYSALPSQNQTNWTASLGGRYDLGRDQVRLAYTHLNEHESPTDIDAIGIQTPVAYSADDVRTSYTAEFGAFKFIPNAEFTSYGFSNTTVNAQPINQTFRNRQTFQGGVTSQYEFSPQRDAVVVVNGYGTHYTTPQIGQPSRDNSGFSVLGGLAYTASGTFRYRALVGVEQRNYSSSGFQTETTPVAEATVIWTPTELTTVTGSLIRAIEDASEDTVVGYTYTGVRAQVDHEFQRNILLQGYAGEQIANYQQGGGSQAITNLGANATWLLDRNFRLTASYDFTNSTSSGTISTVNSVTNGRFTRNIGLLTLRIAL